MSVKCVLVQKMISSHCLPARWNVLTVIGLDFDISFRVFIVWDFLLSLLFVCLFVCFLWSIVASNPFKAFIKTIKSKSSFCLNFCFLTKLLPYQERCPLSAVKTNKSMACVYACIYSCSAWIFLLQKYALLCKSFQYQIQWFLFSLGLKARSWLCTYYMMHHSWVIILYCVFKLWCWKDFRLYHVR